MFRGLISFSLRRPFLVGLLALLLVGVSAYLLPSIPVDVFPELNAPTVVVLTESPGLAADEVEQFVSLPLETAVRGLPAVRRVRSASAIGLSLVWVEFEWGQDIYRARTLVNEKLATARRLLPPDAKPEITPITSITGEIMLLSLSSPDGTRSAMELRSYAEFALRNQLMAVPGVAQVSAIGGELAEYQVLVRQDDLQLYELSLDDVVDAARRSHTTAGAGYLPNVDGLELPVRQTGRVNSVADIAGTTVRRIDGHSLTLGQVADVRLGAAPPRGAGAEAGRAAVVLSVQKSPGTNTLELTAAIDARLAEIDQALPPGMRLNPHVMRQADFIRLSVDNLLSVLRDAAIFVAIILVLFLLDIRTTMITLTALPLSLAVAFLVLWASGMTINVMTLGGLAVAIGELVDDAIIDVENVFRRLRQNAGLPLAQRQPVRHVVFEASNEIRSSVVFATFIIAMVFVPLLFLEGLEGRFFRPLGISYIVATLASLVVALTVTPMLCRLLLGRVAPGTHTDGLLARRLKARYRPIVQWAMHRSRTVLAASLLATVASLGLLSTFGSSFLPEFNEGTFTVFVMAPPGTSLEESNRVANGIERQLVAIDGVRAVVRRTGRAERDEHAEPVSNSEIEVTLLPGRDKRPVRAAIDRVLASVPGITTQVGQPIEHRLSHVLSGTPAAIAVTARGDDLDVLRDLAQRLQGTLRAVPGTRDVNANREVMIQSLPVRYRPRELSAVGLTPADAARQLQTCLAGTRVAEVLDGPRRIGLTVRLHPDDRRTIADVRRIVLRAPGGAAVRLLGDVAEVGIDRYVEPHRARRIRTAAKPSSRCSVAEGYNLGHLVEAVRREGAADRSGSTDTRVTYRRPVRGATAVREPNDLLVMGLGVIVILILVLLVHRRARFGEVPRCW